MAQDPQDDSKAEDVLMDEVEGDGMVALGVERGGGGGIGTGFGV